MTALTGQVLLVEDDILVRMFATDVLEDAGFTVHEAAGGSEALGILTTLGRSVSAVIVDLGLTDGLAAALGQEIRSFWADMPIVVTSGIGAAELEHRFDEDPCARVVTKPYTARTLLRALTDLGVTPGTASPPAVVRCPPRDAYR